MVGWKRTSRIAPACAIALFVAIDAGAQETTVLPERVEIDGATGVAEAPGSRKPAELYPQESEPSIEDPVAEDAAARGPVLLGQAAPAPRGAAAAAPLRFPPFAGAPQIYHYGATGFFLDRPEAALLSAPQKATLARIRGAAQQALAFADRRIAFAEQELWGMTAGDRPDAAGVEAKLAQIEQLRTQQRLTFMRYVGAAARVLSNEQRLAITGAAPPPRAAPPRAAPVAVPPLPSPGAVPGELEAPPPLPGPSSAGRE